ncbi:hypothetical protein K1X84_10715 [bacterium]|nr:hypothetical protein [bacterium]
MVEKLLESVLLLFVGMGGVLISLSGFAAMIWLFKILDEKFNTYRIRHYSETLESTPSEDEPNDELVAVITATAVAILKKPVVIRKIHFLNRSAGSSWAVTGRLNIMASHLISKRK